MCYPPEGSFERSSQGVQLILFPFYWCRKRYWGFQIYRRFFAILKTWKCVIWWDGWTDGTGGRMGRSRKVSFKFLQTLWAFRTCIYILVYKIKIVTNILMGFKIWCQVGVWVTPFSKLPYSREFLNIWSQKLTDIINKSKLGVGVKFSNLQQVGDFSIFGSKSSFSGGVGGIKFEFWCGIFYFKILKSY